MRYPLVKDGVFRTIQGEGALLGIPMVFVRLAGCSIGCPQCDTDYRVHERLTGAEIAERVQAVRGNAQWVWVTGGEPADYNLWELNQHLRLCGWTALATSGTKRLHGERWNFLSVSPHGKPSDLLYDRGSQINLVPGLNGLSLKDWLDFDPSGFEHRWVTPCAGDPETLQECLDFVSLHPSWRLGIQAHKTWGLP